MARKASKEGTRKRKQQIVNAALACFQKHGFYKSSMQEICAVAGLSPGTVYHYFASKDDIILHIAEREVAKSEELAKYLSSVSSLEKGLYAVVDYILGNKADEDFQIYMEVLCESGRNPALADLLLKADQIALTAIQGKLQAEKKGGNIKALEALAAYLGGQLELLEIYKWYKTSPQECKEMAKVCKRVISFLLTDEM